MSVGKRARRARLRTLAIAAGFLAIIGFGYAVFPRHPDLRAFDPAAMAHSETMMWRHYYERRYLSLFVDLYDNSRTQYGFSPWDRTSRTGAQVALPFLEEYFGLLARATPVPLDIEVAVLLGTISPSLRHE